VQGQKDLNAKVIRFIGDAEKRILEDHLRILRAVRFKKQFNFQYEPKTFQALKKHAPLVVDNIANERIGDELNKIIMLPNACEAFEDMEDLGILQVLLPEIQAMKGVAQPMEYHTEGDVWDHTMLALKSLPETTQMPVKWAVLLHDSGKPETFEVKERIRFDHHVEASGRIARSVLKRLRFSKRTIEEVAWLVEHHMMMVPLTEMPDSRKRHWFLHPYFLNLMQLFKADAAGTVPTNLSLYEKIYDLYHKHTKEMPKEPEPLLSGHNVMVITGIKPGPEVGEIMEQMREKQLGKELKNKEDAINWLKENACKDDC
ncbi:HD domain-containing protein, partial [Candidatus Peregrinibacteria bacterium]|nr:HD domain-containing protein [Candidatus Peregrinibacteria bacterium]